MKLRNTADEDNIMERWIKIRYMYYVTAAKCYLLPHWASL